VRYWIVALLLLTARDARAEEPPAPEPEPTEIRPLQAGVVEQAFEPSGEPIEQKRERPKVDGVQERVTPGEVLIWVPRVALFPLYLVSEYLVRKPIGWAISTIEEHRILPKLRHYTTVGEADSERGIYAGVDPILRLDTGFHPAFGLLFWAERILGKGTEARLGVDTDFERNGTVDLRVKLPVSGRLVLTPTFRLEQRDDFRFYGVGAASAEDAQTRFFRRKLFGGVLASLEAPSPGVGATFAAEVSGNEFDCSSNQEFDICGPDSIGNTPDDLLFPVGFDGGYSLLRFKTRLFADSRRARPENGSGARAEVFARWGQGLSEDDVHFIRTGAEGALFWDIFEQRVLGVRVMAETTLRESNVPFAELILPGGSEMMRGFSRGRLHGASAFVASLDYRYPVWSLADGTLFFEAGNAFDELSEVELDALRGSFGFGLRTVGSRHVSVDFLVAAGTTRFDDANFGIESVRLSIGTNWGF
jgi:hypothetical protein